MDWISVKDRLPTDALVLVSVPTLDEERPYIATAWCDSREGEAEWSIICRPFAKAITHWMPLPQPPDTEDYKDYPRDKHSDRYK